MVRSRSGRKKERVDARAVMGGRGRLCLGLRGVSACGNRGGEVGRDLRGEDCRAGGRDEILCLELSK